MKTLHVTHRLPPDGVGGVEQYVQSVASELAARGCEIAILTRSPRRWPRRPKLVEDASGSPVRVFRMRGAGVRLENFLVGSARTEHLAERVLSTLRPDVVHVHHLIGISPRIVSAAQRAGAAVVVTLHDYYFPCPLVHLTKKSGVLCPGPDEGRECARTCFAPEGPAAERWLLRYRYFGQVLALAERVVCPNADLAERGRTMAPLAKIEEMPLAIKPGDGRSAVRLRRPGALRLGFFGTVAPHKGIDILLDAVKRLARPADLVVAGPSADDRYRRSLERRAAAAHLNVTWRGPYAPGDLAGLLADVDVVIAPSQVPEVFPLGVREALAQGVPVIAASQPGLIDVVVDEVNGLLFSPGNAAELAACIERLAAAPGLLDGLRAGAQSTLQVSQAEHVGQLLALYADVVNGPRSNEQARIALDQLHHEALRAGFATARRFRTPGTH
jgi:glycosyltransferase involved in cell wall biosynthesis